MLTHKSWDLSSAKDSIRARMSDDLHFLCNVQVLAMMESVAENCKIADVVSSLQVLGEFKMRRESSGDSRSVLNTLSIMNTQGSPFHWMHLDNRRMEGLLIESDEKHEYNLKDLLPKRKPLDRSGVRYIENTNVDGKHKIMFLLTSIKGVSCRFTNIVVKKAYIDMNKRLLGLLSFSVLVISPVLVVEQRSWMGDLYPIPGSEAMFADLGHFSELSIKATDNQELKLHAKEDNVGPAGMYTQSQHLICLPGLDPCVSMQAAYLSRHHIIESDYHIGFYVSVPGRGKSKSDGIYSNEENLSKKEKLVCDGYPFYRHAYVQHFCN
ncbi:hypothetical protein RHMOL_Rhmol05G0203300 [Rhododendron molle]|uniref:Uncharacterized protein n=1 Tax=Rhododendron molle TaxID=49168 RepID=A0ACC0NST2_RHOML|nr:hypothetical protein RHMOL_Rhmol05G0203300 [Rhododendron molle]